MSRRVQILEPLRGLASFAVLWFHFGYANAYSFRDGIVGSSARYGWLGVDAFFVISGFVMPYAMSAKHYRLRYHWRAFLTKRILRLDPPYLVSIALAIGVAFLATRMPSYRGAAFHVSARQLVLHLGYLNAFAEGARDGWVNPVYWTLAIEFQYYVVIAFAYPLVTHKSARVSATVFVALVALAMAFPNPNLVCAYLPLFGLGFATLHRSSGRLDTAPWLGLVAALTLAAGVTLGWPQAAAGSITALAIGFAPERTGGRVFVKLGMISYSLYLVHVPIGGRIVNLGARLGDGAAARALVLVAATAVSLGSAYALYRLVERPAKRWSDDVDYSPIPIEIPALAK